MSFRSEFARGSAFQLGKLVTTLIIGIAVTEIAAQLLPSWFQGFDPTIWNWLSWWTLN